LLIKKILISVFTIFAAMSLTFVLVRNMPGDIIYSMALDKASTEGIPFDVAYEEIKGMYGVGADDPLYVQYFRYVANIFRGNLGDSVQYQIPVIRIMFSALPWTLLVLSISIVLSFVVGAIIGMLAAWKRKTLLESFVTAYASITDATPDYLTAVILLIIFAVNLRLFPLKGAYNVDVTPGFNLKFIISVLYHAFLPIMAYTIENVGGWMLMMKASATSVLGEDYITAAQMRGLRERRIAISYLGKNAILPPFTRLAIAIGGMLGGSALIESVFAYPGIGFFFGKAVALRDYPLMQGLFLLTTVGVIAANLLADLLYSRLDPRVKVGE